uniref:Uncharacterized protein n=1 Tax=Plectus sambesii TaxID=2011161 RepID=A0A914UYY1_9BILA
MTRPASLLAAPGLLVLFIQTLSSPVGRVGDSSMSQFALLPENSPNNCSDSVVEISDSPKAQITVKAVAKTIASNSQSTSANIAPRPKSKHVWVNPSIAAATVTADPSASPVQLRRPQPTLPPILPSVDFGAGSKSKNDADGDHDLNQRTASSFGANSRRRVVQRNHKNDEENDPMARPKRGDLRGRLLKRKSGQSDNRADDDVTMEEVTDDDVMAKLSALFDSSADRSTDLIVQELLKGDSDRKGRPAGAPPVKLRKKWKHNDGERANGVSRSETIDSDPDSALISVFGKDLASQLKSEGIDLKF